MNDTNSRCWKRTVSEEVGNGGDNKRRKSDDPVVELLLKVREPVKDNSPERIDRVFEIVLNHECPGLTPQEWREVVLFFINSGLSCPKFEQVLQAYNDQVSVLSRHGTSLIEQVWFTYHLKAVVECDVILLLVKYLPEELSSKATFQAMDKKWRVADLIVDMAYRCGTSNNFYKITEILNALEATEARGLNLIAQLDWEHWIGRMLNNNVSKHLTMGFLAKLFTKHSASIGSRPAILHNFTMKTMFATLLPHLKELCFQPKSRLNPTMYPHNHAITLFKMMRENRSLPALQVFKIYMHLPHSKSVIKTHAAAFGSVLEIAPGLQALDLRWFRSKEIISHLNTSEVVQVLCRSINAVKNSGLHHLKTINLELPFTDLRTDQEPNEEADEDSDEDSDEESDEESGDVDATNTICTLYGMKHLQEIRLKLPPQQVTLTSQLKEVIQSNVSLKRVEFLDHVRPLNPGSYIHDPTEKVFFEVSKDVYATMAKQYAMLNACGRSLLMRDQASSSHFLRVVERLKIECFTEETLTHLFMITREFVGLLHGQVKSTI